jgi:hypothetical protein
LDLPHCDGRHLAAIPNYPRNWNCNHYLRHRGNLVQRAAFDGPDCVCATAGKTIPPKIELVGIAWIAGKVSGAILGGMLADAIHKRLQTKYPQLAATPRNPVSID